MADARRRLAELLDAVEAGGEVSITRRGRPVARMLSPQAYDVLLNGRRSLWVAIEENRPRGIDSGEDDWDTDLRDPAPGRPSPWERD